MHFVITEKLTTDYVSLYNNAGFISKVSEEIASKNTEKCRCQQYQSFYATPQGTSTNIGIKVILL